MAKDRFAMRLTYKRIGLMVCQRLYRRRAPLFEGYCACMMSVPGGETWWDSPQCHLWGQQDGALTMARGAVGNGFTTLA